jgi:hypothetical protein
MKKLGKNQRFFVSLPSIGRNTCPMVVFSGILQSPKPPPLGDVRGTVSVHRHGHCLAIFLNAFVDCCIFA